MTKADIQKCYPEVDSEEQGETNNQTQASSSETLEYSGGSVETSTGSGVDGKRTESA